jgi:hypothetical protein
VGAEQVAPGWSTIFCHLFVFLLRRLSQPGGCQSR